MRCGPLFLFASRPLEGEPSVCFGMSLPTQKSLELQVTFRRGGRVWLSAAVYHRRKGVDDHHGIYAEIELLGVALEASLYDSRHADDFRRMTEP
jgi:hypothetical protein